MCILSQSEKHKIDWQRCILLSSSAVELLSRSNFLCKRMTELREGLGAGSVWLLAALSRLLIVPNGWLIKKGVLQGMVGVGWVWSLENEQQ